MHVRRSLISLLLGVAMLLAAWALPALGDTTTAHSSTIDVACPGETTTVDANAFAGQKAEVTAYYRASGTVCRLFDTGSGALLYDPSK